MFLFLSTFTVSAAENENLLFPKSNTYNDIFCDISESDWYYKYVAAAYEFGVMSGYENGKFDPNGNITISESITVAARIRSQAKKITIPAFEGEKWYTMYVKFSESVGIIPKDAFNFRYEENITRAEYIYILYNSLPVDELTNENPYISKIQDMDKNDKYHDIILKAMKAGLVTGKDSYGNYFPNDKITRAEASTILIRLIDRTQRISHVREITMEKAKSQTYDKTENFEENKSILNYGYHNDSYSIFSGYYIGTTNSIYCYIYNENELNSYLEILKTQGYTINQELTSAFENTYKISSKNKKLTFIIYLFNYYDQVWIVFPWDEEFKKIFEEIEKENSNSEEVSIKNKEPWEKSTTYLENTSVINLGQMAERDCIKRELFVDSKGTYVRYVYNYYPNELFSYYQKIQNKNFILDPLSIDSNKLFLDTTYVSRNTSIRIFVNFIDNTITIEFPKTNQSDL